MYVNASDITVTDLSAGQRMSRSRPIEDWTAAACNEVPQLQATLPQPNRKLR